MNILGKNIKPVKIVLYGSLYLLIGFIAIQLISKYRGTSDNSAISKEQNNVAKTDRTSVSSNSGSDNIRSRKALPTEPVLDPSKKVTMGTAQLAPSGFYKYVYDDDGIHHHLIDKKLRSELIHEGFFPSEEDLKKGLRGYIDEMMNHDGVTNKRYIQFIVSSGAMEHVEVQNAVKALEDGGKGYIVTRTTVEQEGRYALEATLLDGQKDNSFIVDPTPSFTRLSWYDGGQPKTIKLPGSKYYLDDVKESQTISALSDEQARAIVIEKLKELPLKNRENGIIIWAAADNLNKDASGRYVYLEDQYSIDEKDKKLFLSGLNILHTIQDETGTPLYFDLKTSYAIGFGQSLFKK